MPFVPNATPSRRQPSREGFTRPDVLLQALEHYHDDSGTGARTRRDRAPFRRLDNGGAEVGSIRISGVSRSGGLDGGVVVGEARVPSCDDAAPNDTLVR